MKLAEHETQETHFKALSKAYRTGSIAGISHHYGALRFLAGHNHALQCAMMIEENKFRKNEAEFIQILPDSYSAFCVASVSKRQLPLFNAINRNNRIQKSKNPSLRKQLRDAHNLESRKRQEDAPEQGAESKANV